MAGRGYTTNGTEVYNGRAQVAVKSNGFAAAGQRLIAGPDKGLLLAGGKMVAGFVRLCNSQADRYRLLFYLLLATDKGMQHNA